MRKRSPVQSKAGADEFEHQLRTALLAPTHTTKEAEIIDIEADSYRLKEAKELTAARTKRRRQKPAS